MASFLFKKCRYQRFALAEAGAISEMLSPGMPACDHLLLSPSVTGRLVRAEVDSGMRGWEKASNHAPTWIELAATTKPAQRAGAPRP